MNIDVRPVRTRSERRAFLTFPWRIYRGDPLWVPPLLPERKITIDPRKGPFFQRGEADLFIAWRGGKPAGTICAAVDRETNRASGKREGMWGFWECVDDDAVAAALFNRAAQWCRERGLESMVGPFHLDHEAGYGILIEGRDRPPALLCGHTPPYYLGLVERHGFVPARGDNLAYAVDIARDTPQFQRLARIAERVRQRGGIAIRDPDMARWHDEAECLFVVINRALEHLIDFVPWTHDEFIALLEPFRQIADPELLPIAEINGQVVGWFPGLPNLNEAFIHANGLRYPLDYVRLWWHMRRRPRCLAIKSVLILPEYWNTGVAVLLFDEMLRRARAKGYTWLDLSLTSEDNPYTPALATRMGATLYKRYRVFRLAL
ncbi:MAG: GNAT family N-acetyltransferase [Anaerolineae bacterium]|nr:GNAT family N-acetyltransferase [Anaerolineae bacterium]